MTRIFITGTGTDVGKTVVARAIVRALTQMGHRVRAIKPVESGVPVVDGVWAPSDVLALRAAAGSDAPIDTLCTYMFKDPVSPHQAAANEGRTIDPLRILALLEEAPDDGQVVIAEGAGGLLVPLSDDILYADVIP